MRLLYEGVKQGVARNLAGILGGANIKYVVSNPEPPVQVPLGQARFLNSQLGLKRLVEGKGITVLENPLAQSQVEQPTSSCVIAGGYSVLEDLTENPHFSFKRTAVYFADQVVSTGGWSTLARIIMRSHCLIMGPGAGGELTVLRSSVASVQAPTIAPSEWPSGPVDPLGDSQANPANSVTIPVAGQLVWDTVTRSAGSYRVWVRALIQPGAASIPVTVNGLSADGVVPSLPASVGYQWLPTRPVHLNGGRVRIVLSGVKKGLSPEVAEIALVRSNSAGGIPPGVQRGWVVLDKDAHVASMYRRPAIEWSRPIATGPWHPTLGVRVAHASRAAVTLTPIAANRSLFSLAYAQLPQFINASDPLAFRFQGTGSGASFDLNFFFKDGYQKSFKFQDVTSRPRILFFTPQEGGPAVQPSPRLVVQNRYLSSNTEVPNWSQLERVTLSTASLIWPGGKIRIAGPYRIKLAHSLPYFVGHLPTATSHSSPGAATSPMATMVATTAPVRNVRSGILDFSQSFDSHWQLTGSRVSIHTVELGFENSYFIGRGAYSATLSYSLAVVGESGTMVSVVVWCIGLLSLLIWPYYSNVSRYRHRQQRGSQLVPHQATSARSTARRGRSSPDAASPRRARRRAAHSAPTPDRHMPSRRAPTRLGARGRREARPAAPA